MARGQIAMPQAVPKPKTDEEIKQEKEVQDKLLKQQELERKRIERETARKEEEERKANRQPSVGTKTHIELTNFSLKDVENAIFLFF